MLVTNRLMGAIWFRSRTELRTRWPGALILVLLVGIAGGAVLTALAGARRTASAFERFQDSARSPDVIVTYPTDIAAEVRKAVADAPGVEAVTHMRVMAAFPASGNYVPMMADLDGGLHRDLERGKLLAGRFEHQDARAEIALSEIPARLLGVGVGDTLGLQTFTPAQFAQVLTESDAPQEPEGPRLRLRVVGVYRSPFDLGAVRDDAVPALLPRGAIAGYENRIGYPPVRILAVRLVAGEAGAPAFFRGLRSTVTDRRLSLEPAALTAGVGDSLGVLALGLVLFAGVAGLASLIAIGQALARRAALGATDLPTLRALGMSGRQRFAALAGDTIPIALLGAALAAVTAIAASPLMPIGLGRRAEPDLGIDLDPLVLGAGFVGIALTVLAVGALGAWRAERAITGESDRASSRTSAIVNALARRGARPTTVAGVRFALERGRGRTAVPVRAVLLAAVAAIAGVVAVLVFAASLDRLVASPRAWGWTFDAHSGLDAKDLARDPTINAIADVNFVQITLRNRPVDAFTWKTVKGALEPTIVSGRAPRRATEVALGGDTLAGLAVKVGETVDADGRDGPVKFRVVGQAVFPSVDDPVPLADGALLAFDGLRRIDDLNELESFNRRVIRFAPGVDVDAARRRVARLGNDDPNGQTIGPRVPAEIARLQQLEALPLALAGFLALLGVFALGHGLVSAVRRRRRDLALFKTLGFRRSQVSATIAWQATTVALVGAVIGIPVGVVLGRWTWSLVARGLGVESVPVGAPIAIAGIALATLVVVNAVAFLPGRIAARTKPGVALRVE